VWFIWWFLTEHTDMPYLPGQMFTNERYTAGIAHGMLTMISLYVEAGGMDLGDLWFFLVAHYRTWDFSMENEWRAAEQRDMADFLQYVKPELPRDLDLETRKTTAFVNSSGGTSGQWVPGPLTLLPGPFGWNCLTMTSVESNRVIVLM
jgi:hypothetical protein